MARKITTGEVGGAAGGINITNTTLNAANNLDITIDPQGSGILDIRGVAALDDQFELRFKEDAASGTNYVGFKAPATVAGNLVWTLPAADAGTSGYALTSNASGVLNWSAVGPEHADETATATTYYPVISTQTSAGFLTTSRVSTTKLSFQPSTGTLTASVGSFSGLSSSGTIALSGTVGVTGNASFSGTVGITNTTTARAINPEGNNAYDLGTASLRWRNIYTNDLHLSNGIGDYTVVEGEEDLFLYNNKSGKVFKFALIEVDASEAPAKAKEDKQ